MVLVLGKLFFCLASVLVIADSRIIHTRILSVFFPTFLCNLSISIIVLMEDF